MAPKRQKAKGRPKMRSKLRHRWEPVSSLSTSSPNLRVTRLQNTILRYLQLSSPSPVAPVRGIPSTAASSSTLRSDFSSVTNSSTFSGRLGNSSSNGRVAMDSAFPESSSLSPRSDTSIPMDDSLGNARMRRCRSLDEPALPRPPIGGQYGGKECIPGALFPEEALIY
jgi:hypothetical protein